MKISCPARISRFIHSKASWVKPVGYDTGINIFNCVAKEKVPLISKKEGILTWYTCGPTVYDEAHIGHASCYLKIDIIQRILSRYFNFNLITVMNITDIDDKIIKRSKELDKPVVEISKFYEKSFFDDLAKLNIMKPNLILRVSENMPCIKDFINSLIVKESAYKSEDGSVYFDIKKFGNYGKLVGVETSNDEAISDFALWKASKMNEPYWDSPWGSGRPGWHIECSALASNVFGSSIDIHAGGMDLKFPHHENEEAQSCVYHSSSQWVNYWIHIGQLHAKSSEKMSKSLKNTISINTLLENTKPDEFRLACLMSHYRSRMEYTEELVKMASRTLKKYRTFVDNCDNYILKSSDTISTDGPEESLLCESRNKLHEAFCDDFNTPAVINILNKILRTTNPLMNSNSISTATVIGLRNFVSQTLNLFNISESEEMNIKGSSNDSELLDILKEFRWKVREVGLATKNRDILKFCDEVRSNLRNKGIELKDVSKGQVQSTQI